MFDRLRSLLRVWLGVPELEPTCKHEPVGMTWHNLRPDCAENQKEMKIELVSWGLGNDATNVFKIDGRVCKVTVKLCRKCHCLYPEVEYELAQA